jgi:hypothetical protein
LNRELGRGGNLERVLRKVVFLGEEAFWSKTSCGNRQTSRGEKLTAWDFD